MTVRNPFQTQVPCTGWRRCGATARDKTRFADDRPTRRRVAKNVTPEIKWDQDALTRCSDQSPRRCASAQKLNPRPRGPGRRPRPARPRRAPAPPAAASAAAAPTGRTRGCLLRSTPETSRRLRSQIRESPDSPGRFRHISVGAKATLLSSHAGRSFSPSAGNTAQRQPQEDGRRKVSQTPGDPEQTTATRRLSHRHTHLAAHTTLTLRRKGPPFVPKWGAFASARPRSKKLPRIR